MKGCSKYVQRLAMLPNDQLVHVEITAVAGTRCIRRKHDKVDPKWPKNR